LVPENDSSGDQFLISRKEVGIARWSLYKKSAERWSFCH